MQDVWYHKCSVLTLPTQLICLKPTQYEDHFPQNQQIFLPLNYRSHELDNLLN